MTCTTCRVPVEARGRSAVARPRSGPDGASTPQHPPREAAAEDACAHQEAPARSARSGHHDAELVGLGLIAVGVFLACVLWFGLTRRPGAGCARTSAIGWAAYLAPVVLIPLGGLIVTRSALVAVSPFKLGLSVTVVGLMLALGASHGGRVGDRLESLVALAVGTTGAEILGVLLTLFGVLFLTGASLGALLRRSGDAVKSASTRVRRERPAPTAEPELRADRRTAAVPPAPEARVAGRRRPRLPGSRLGRAARAPRRRRSAPRTPRRRSSSLRARRAPSTGSRTPLS